MKDSKRQTMRWVEKPRQRMLDLKKRQLPVLEKTRKQGWLGIGRAWQQAVTLSRWSAAQRQLSWVRVRVRVGSWEEAKRESQ